MFVCPSNVLSFTLMDKRVLIYSEAIQNLLVLELEDCAGMDLFTSSQTSVMPLENYSMLGKKHLFQHDSDHFCWIKTVLKIHVFYTKIIQLKRLKMIGSIPFC